MKSIDSQPERAPRGPWYRLCAVGVALIAVAPLALLVEPSPEAPPAIAQPARPDASPPAASAATASLTAVPAPPREPNLAPPTVIRVRGHGASHEFIERRYDPPLELDLDRPALPEGPFATPEDAIASHVSAMAQGNIDGPIAMLDPSERPLWRERLAENASKFLDYWGREVAGHTWVATRRIDIPGYVIVYRQREGRAENTLPTAFKQDAGGGWWMTHELDGHPVYAYEHNGEATDVQIVAR